MKRMNFIKKTISFLTIICCLAGSLLPAYAAEQGGSSNIPSGAPRATFTNEPNNSPDLFVRKIVENAVQGAQYAAPERAAYKFVLKIEDKVAKNVQYRLLDDQYGELIKKSGGRKVNFTTDSSGVFTLEAGQTAWFEYVGTGKMYEVIELPEYDRPVMEPVKDAAGNPVKDAEGNPVEQVVKVQNGYTLYEYKETTDAEGKTSAVETYIPELDEIKYEPGSLYVDGYTQKSLAGDSVNGASTGEKAILFNGNTETFTNQYTGKGTGKTTTLEISKTISFPAGYTVPETPDFQFQVVLDGESYAEKEFTVVDSDTGKPVMTTDSSSAPAEGEAPDTSEGGEQESNPGGEEPLPTDENGGNGETEEATNTAQPVQLTGTTKSDGTFTLKGGQTAVFEDVPTGIDYRVYELLEDSEGTETWWAVGDTEKKGSTQAPLTSIDFNNANVSFVVTKRMKDYSKPNVEFTFRLTDENNKVLPEKSYYLYHTNGTPVYENNMHVKGTTESNGEFILRPGQAAVFVGMTPGENFRVREKGNPDYKQLVPALTDNDVHTVLSSGSPVFVDFVNEPADNRRALTVTKNLVFEEEGPMDNADFHFILYKQLKTKEDVEEALSNEPTEERIDEAVGKGTLVLAEFTGVQQSKDTDQPGASDEEIKTPENISVINDIWYYTNGGTRYEIYASLADAAYSVQEGLSAPSYRARKAGEFTIKAEQTATFEYLHADRNYMVRETGLTKEYTEIETNDSLYTKIYTSGLLNETVDAQKAELTGDGTSFTFVNQYKPEKVDLNLTKVDKNNDPITDQRAGFRLYWTKGRENPVEDDIRYTDAKGELTFQGLKPGTYWLYEEKAPSGYKLLAAPIEIQIAWGENGEPEVTIDGTKATKDFDNGVVNTYSVNKSTDGKYTIQFSVVNAEFYKLPSTGGMGTNWYTIGGILLMIAAMLILYKNKRAGEVRGS